LTIKEVEERCGMDRANIRFYEKEGLVSPVRQENGYRDYSEADVQMLLRIKLLRSLHFSLEEIRKLAQGEEELTAVLARKVHELEQERQELNYAKELCRTMQQDQVRFTNLDADKYLDQARRTVPEGSGIGKVTKEDRLPGVYHPWRRYFARTLDLSICGLLWTALLALVFRVNIANRSTLMDLMNTSLAMVILLFLEPLCLRLFGTTPGKFILGLRVENEDGGRVPYGEAFMRTGSVLWHGQGFGIPIVSLVMLIKSYKRCVNEDPQPWEENHSARLVLKGSHPLRAIPYLAAFALVFFLTLCSAMSTEVPPHRGELTVAEFAQNYNYLSKHYGIDGAWKLSENGTWEHSATDLSLTDDGDTPFPEFRYELKDGIITGIYFDADLSHDSGWIRFYNSNIQMQLATMAYAGAQREIGLLSGERSNAIDKVGALMDDMADTFDFTLGDIDIEGGVEYSGYLSVGGVLIPEESSQDQHCSAHFSMEQSK